MSRSCARPTSLQRRLALAAGPFTRASATRPGDGERGRRDACWRVRGAVDGLGRDGAGGVAAATIATARYPRDWPRAGNDTVAGGRAGGGADARWDRELAIDAYNRNSQPSAASTPYRDRWSIAINGEGEEKRKVPSGLLVVSLMRGCQHVKIGQGWARCATVTEEGGDGKAGRREGGGRRARGVGRVGGQHC